MHQLTEEYSIVQCNKCKVSFLNPTPSVAYIDTIYSKSYYESWGLFNDEPLVKKMKLSTFRKRINTIEKLVPIGKILDVGCATGYFLEVARDRGWITYGVEVSKFAAEIANSKRGLEIYNGMLEDVEYSPNTFQAITLFDYLEHIIDPIRIMKIVFKFLDKGGIVYLTTPNISSITHFLMKEKWTHFKIEHLFYFNPNSIKYLLNKIGFQLINLKPAYKILNLYYIHNQLQIYHTPIFSQICKGLLQILPQKTLGWHIYIPIGELQVIARKN